MSGPLQALVARYDRLAARGEVAAFGLSWERVSHAVVISSKGEPVDVQPLLDTSGRKPQPRAMLVPRAVKRTSGIASNFLWDKTPYVLGVSGGQGRRTAAEHAAFVKAHRDLLGITADDGLRALRAFLERWTPDRFAAPPFQPEMLDTNVVFALDGGVGFLHERPTAMDVWLAHLASGEATRAMCLVTGWTAPVARLHPVIKGVMGAQSSGASLVSFNDEAYESHGKKQGLNAPVSEAAAFAYGTALNALLARDSRNALRVGDATVVFWSEVPEAEALVRGFWDPPGPDARGEDRQVRAVLEQMTKGRPLETTVPDIDQRTAFYVLGLAPNAARLSIRFWHTTTFGELGRNFQRWWSDLRIEPEPWGERQPALWRLLFELAAQGKTENVPAHLAGEVMRSVLTGRRLPRSLLSTAIMRMRSDRHDGSRRMSERDFYGRRAAIVKAVLVRELRFDDPALGGCYVSLDRKNPDPGYRMGRLFSVLERVQLAALGNVNSTIRDRYYGSASATPRSIFPLLLRNSRPHLANLRKSRGAAKIKSPNLIIHLRHAR